MPEYRITYSIERRDDGHDFTEIGFGSSTAASTIEDALYAVQSQIQNREWETTDGMPDPSEATR
jgi:hypothetical protein